MKRMLDQNKIDWLEDTDLAKISALLSQVSIDESNFLHLAYTIFGDIFVEEFVELQLGIGGLVDQNDSPLFPLENNAGKVLAVNSDEDGLVAVEGLPAIESGDSGKVVKVNNGETGYELGSITGLPAIESGDGGKVVKVNNGETGYELGSVSGGTQLYKHQIQDLATHGGAGRITFISTSNNDLSGSASSVQITGLIRCLSARSGNTDYYNTILSCDNSAPNIVIYYMKYDNGNYIIERVNIFSYSDTLEDIITPL